VFDIACMIPVYNNADTLERCIKSVYNDGEVIIVVDGIFTGGWGHYLGPKKVKEKFSTDNTYEICRKYGIKTWYRQTTGPPGTKLNAWLSLVPKSCQWILQMDADEVMNSNGVKNLKNFLVSEEGQKHGNFSIMVYHLYDDCDHYLDMNTMLEDQSLRKEYCYFSRVHYYKPRFEFDNTSSELMYENGVKDKFYKPTTENNAYGYSYCIPESVCKLADLRFIRKDAYQQNRICGTKKERNKKYVAVQYGPYIKQFQVKEFDLKSEFKALE